MFNLLSNLKFTEQATNDPYIDIQPTVAMSRCIPRRIFGTKIKTGYSLSGYRNQNIPFSLEFSINHNMIVEDWENVTVKKLMFDKINIILKRYHRKTIAGEYCEPVVVNIPSLLKEINGFRIVISDSAKRTDVFKVKRGCQLVSLCSYNVFEGKVTKEIIRSTVAKFFCLMGISEKTINDFAFKFIITINKRGIKKDNILKISTTLFKYIFEPLTYLVITKEVNESDYYLEYTP